MAQHLCVKGAASTLLLDLSFGSLPDVPLIMPAAYAVTGRSTLLQSLASSHLGQRTGKSEYAYLKKRTLLSEETEPAEMQARLLLYLCS